MKNIHLIRRTIALLIFVLCTITFAQEKPPDTTKQTPIRPDTTIKVYRPGKDGKIILPQGIEKTNIKKETEKAIEPEKINKIEDEKKAINTEPDKDTKPEKPKDKKIAITFDNLPGDQIYNKEERIQINRDILSALKKHNALATGFVIGESVDGDDWEGIVNWLDDGHFIGFHTFTGQDVNGAPLPIFISDLKKGKEAVEDLVTTYHQTGRYFRFPFFHYATDEKSKQLIVDELINMKVRIAHVSIVIEDFVYNMSLEKILKTGNSVDLHYLRDEYMAHILERLGYYESLAQEIAGRSIRHIIQFRTNRLNSLLLDDILTEIADKGYQFITIKEALRDKVYRMEETYYGEKGLS